MRQNRTMKEKLIHMAEGMSEADHTPGGAGNSPDLRARGGGGIPGLQSSSATPSLPSHTHHDNINNVIVHNPVLPSDNNDVISRHSNGSAHQHNDSIGGISVVSEANSDMSNPSAHSGQSADRHSNSNGVHTSDIHLQEVRAQVVWSQTNIWTIIIARIHKAIFITYCYCIWGVGKLYAIKVVLP